MELPKGFLLVLIGLLLVLSVAFVLPFLQYFLLAVLLAFLFAPVHDRIESRTGPRIAAGALSFVATVAIVLPLILLVHTIAMGALAVFERIQAGDLTLENVEAVLAIYGIGVDLGAALQSAARSVGAGTVRDLLGVFGAVTHAAIGVGLTLFLLFYFLKDGDRFARWLRRIVPLPAAVQTELYREFSEIMWAVVAGHILVAVVQGVLAGIGLLVAGVPNAPFWTAVMIVLSLLPIVGSVLVWGPASLFLLVGGRPLAAAFLLVYGSVVVGLSDDYLRPILVDRYARLNPALILVGVVGGIYVLGVMGLFFGPIVVGALRATLDAFAREYGSADGGRSGSVTGSRGEPPARPSGRRRAATRARGGASARRRSRGRRGRRRRSASSRWGWPRR